MIRAKLLPEDTERSVGQFHCSRPDCVDCVGGPLVLTSVAKSTRTAFQLKLTQHFTCAATNVIYLITCRTCGQQGVGETVDLKNRLSNYRHLILHSTDPCRRLVEHFRSCGWGAFSITCLESTPAGEYWLGYRRRREQELRRKFGAELNTIGTTTNISHAYPRSHVRPRVHYPAAIVLRTTLGRPSTDSPPTVPGDVEMES